VAIDMGGGTQYITYENKDYSNVRGVVISINKKQSHNYWFNLSYTYQVAEGSNSDPGDAFGALEANREPRKYIIPLAWDQRHTLNSAIGYNIGKWGATLTDGWFWISLLPTLLRVAARRQLSVQPSPSAVGFATFEIFETSDILKFFGLISCLFGVIIS
jgi:hypothetical protein